MADNPFLLPDGTVDILAVTNHSKKSDTSIEGEIIGKDDYFSFSDKMKTPYGDEEKEPLEGEIVPPSAKEQGLRFMLDAMKKVHRNNPRRPVLEGEVITPADDEKERSDNAAVIVEVGLAVLATGDYVALPPIWHGANVEKEVKDITALQIEKKD